MAQYKLTRYEQESVISYNAEEDSASIYSCDPVVMRKLDKLCTAAPDSYKLVRADQYGRYYTAPKGLISFRTPRVFTPEQLAAAQEHGRRQSQFLAKSTAI